MELNCVLVLAPLNQSTLLPHLLESNYDLEILIAYVANVTLYPIKHALRVAVCRMYYSKIA